MISYVFPTMKKLTSMRLSIEAAELRDKLAATLGISKSSVIELAVRKLAQSENIPVPSKKEKS